LGQQIPEFRDGFDVRGKESKGREGLADLDIQKWLQLQIGLAVRIHYGYASTLNPFVRSR
jgi:hypothetical protein